jgi:hypothetical protein
MHKEKSYQIKRMFTGVKCWAKPLSENKSDNLKNAKISQNMLNQVSKQTKNSRINRKKG